MAKMRGAKMTPRNLLLSAPRFKPMGTPPQNVAYVPKRLDMWGNDQYGDCVSAEEAFAKACYVPEIFISAAVVIEWARKNGFLNGAYLQEVMDAMKASGFAIGSQLYNDGVGHGVDWADEPTLQAAIAQGPVKIAIDADALPPAAGDSQGWFAITKLDKQNIDHCVSISGYGTAAQLYAELGLPVPSTLDSALNGYLLFTWGTIGFVSHDWLMGCCAEAWVRMPTTVGVPALTPSPVPDPGPSPTPTPSPWPHLGPILAMMIQLACAYGPAILPAPWNTILANVCGAVGADKCKGCKPDSKELAAMVAALTRSHAEAA